MGISAVEETAEDEPTFVPCLFDLSEINELLVKSMQISFTHTHTHPFTWNTEQRGSTEIY